MRKGRSNNKQQQQQQEPTRSFPQLTSTTPRTQATCCNISGPCAIRQPCYILSMVLLFLVTTMILIALCTNNWDKTAYQLRKDTYYTNGLWFTCRNVYVEWYSQRLETFCQTLIYTSEPWRIACQVLYTIGAGLNVIALGTSFIGLCCDLAGRRAAMPSLTMWIIIASCVFQVVTISVYGAKGIGDYTLLEPDYSIIISAVAVLVDFICAVLLFIEFMCYPKQNRLA